mgnify:CR=1 FL=1
MSNSLGDPYKYKIWKFMSIKDILNYCIIDTNSYKICNDPYTWKFLIYRDFNINNLDHISDIGELKRIYFIQYIKNKTYEYNLRYLFEYYRSSYNNVQSLISRFYDLNDQLMMGDISKAKYNIEVDKLRELFADILYTNKILI